MADFDLSASFIPSLHKPSSLLPIARHRQSLLYLVETFTVTIIVGQTGSYTLLLAPFWEREFETHDKEQTAFEDFISWTLGLKRLADLKLYVRKWEDHADPTISRTSRMVRRRQDRRGHAGR